MAQEIRRKTKIVCTIGPASKLPQVLEALILAGMNVDRFNFSHGTYEEHVTEIKTIQPARNDQSHQSGDCGVRSPSQIFLYV